MTALETDLSDLMHDRKVRSGELAEELRIRSCDECTIRYGQPEDYEAHGCICERMGYPVKRGLSRWTVRAMMQNQLLAGGESASDLGMTPQDSFVVAALRQRLEAMKWGGDGE